MIEQTDLAVLKLKSDLERSKAETIALEKIEHSRKKHGDASTDLDTLDHLKSKPPK